MRPPRPPREIPRRLRRGAYLLPSLFTIGNMLLGFYAIVSALDGEFLKAALLVFMAAVLDLLDGRIARMTGTPVVVPLHASLTAIAAIAAGLIVLAWVTLAVQSRLARGRGTTQALRVGE